MSTPNDPARSASVGEQRTPRAPARARLPLLPSGPGGFTGCTPHEGSRTTVVAELWAELAAGQLESAAEDSPSWPRAHAWKACWGQPLASSNLASSAVRRRLGGSSSVGAPYPYVGEPAGAAPSATPTTAPRCFVTRLPGVSVPGLGVPGFGVPGLGVPGLRVPGLSALITAIRLQTQALTMLPTTLVALNRSLEAFSEAMLLATTTMAAVEQLAERIETMVEIVETPVRALSPGMRRLAVVLDDPVLDGLPTTLHRLSSDALPMLRKLADTEAMVSGIASSTEQIRRLVGDTGELLLTRPPAGTRPPAATGKQSTPSGSPSAESAPVKAQGRQSRAESTAGENPVKRSGA